MSISVDAIVDDVSGLEPSAATYREERDHDMLYVGDLFLPDRDWFEAYAVEVLRGISRSSGIGVDWNRVDLASKSVPVSLFPFNSGTVSEALEAYMQWSGLLVVETRNGTLAALNPNAYESGRAVHRVILLQASRDNGNAIARDDEGWFPISVGDVEESENGALTIDFPLAHTDEKLLQRSMSFCLNLENGDILDLESSSISGSVWRGSHAQLWTTEFRAHGPMHPDGESAVKAITVLPVDLATSILGHEPTLSTAGRHSL